MVDLEGNSLPIEEIQEGDWVLARSELDPQGPLELKRVEEKFVRTAAVMELVIQGQAIKTTAEHPFYVPAQERFVPAGELQVGDQLVSSQGVLVTIESISNLNEITTVYNLRVADHHTYFVGGALWGWDVWVHNATFFRYIRGSTGDEITDVATNSKWVRDPNITIHEIVNSGTLGRELQHDAPTFMVMANIPDSQMRTVQGSSLNLTEYENLVNVPKERLTKLVVRKDGNDPYYGSDGRRL